MTATATNVMRWRAIDSLWLCVAIVLHALLLLIPALQRNQTTISTAPLSITLLTPAPIENPFIDEPESKKNELPMVKNKTVTLDEHPVPELANLEEPEDQVDQEPPGEKVILSTARLLETASEMAWPAPAADDSRHLGVFVPQPLPENWRSGSGIGDKILNPMVRTGKTEIVDSWLAADGSHNVIVNTPGGQTLCGWALPWDPMQPLVEHVMHFRRCGGNQKRTLEMVHRIKRLTSSLH